MNQFQRIQRSVFSFFLCVIIAISGFLVWNSAVIEGSQKEKESQESKTVTVMGPQTINVILERVYLDGETSQEKVQETIWSTEDFWAFYEDWVLVDQNENEMIFRKEIDDISPLLKMNGYFGITEEGILSIYEGEPNKERVIQSFFQLDTAKLKSQQHSDLMRGIPVQDLKHYEEVLQVFGQYKSKQM
ncbi:intercompartmental signaling factor BofC [Halalkalibacter alkalisediminis]|uniref:BofC C-terminal domain-containing protein n=1 Tax=Halalkalibacter alkalisediminis TaxID=935616 RepID=A0ABV6NM26_9BACI|nr:intercompartmental signaling factor BofC [Halalkalibacter alkalisediminis]